MAGDIKSRINGRFNLQNHRLYCIGIGGVGVSALAELMKQAGCEIAGSDMDYNEYCRHLEDIGVHIAPSGHRAENVPAEPFDAVIFSGAVKSTNPELSYLLKRDRAMNWHRGEFLGEFSRCFDRWVSVAGSHGKSSVSAMLSWILHCHGVDSGMMIGASYSDNSPRVSLGNGDIFVTEADENDHALTLLQGELALITNIDGDHAWNQEALDQQELEFRMFCRQHRRQICVDSANTRRVLAEVPEVEFLGGEKLARLEALMPERFLEYERTNGALAIAGAEHLGIKPEDAAGYMASYPGIKRRQSVLFESEKLQIVEDYAHHPAELAASLKVLQKRSGNRRMVVVFEPHRYERLTKYFNEFVSILSAPHLDVRLMDVFSAWKVQSIDSFDSADLAEAIRRHGGKAVLMPGENVNAMAAALLKEAADDSQPRQIALIGAGNIHELAGQLMSLVNSNEPKP